MAAEVGSAWNFSVNWRTFRCCGLGSRAKASRNSLARATVGMGGLLRQQVEQLLVRQVVGEEDSPSLPAERLLPLRPLGDQHGQPPLLPGQLGIGADPLLIILEFVAHDRQGPAPVDAGP